MRPSENDYTRQILQSISTGKRITQRSLATDLGVALGLTNLLIRRLVAKGYVKVAGMGTRHLRYLMTPAGWEALGSATRQALENTVHLYTQTREQIRETLSAVSDRCEVDANGHKRIVFFGAGDVAEIAYVSLQRTDLTLVGVVDDQRTGLFFGVPIVPSDRLSRDALDDLPYTHLVVTTVQSVDEIQTRLRDRAIPTAKISYVS